MTEDPYVDTGGDAVATAPQRSLEERLASDPEAWMAEPGEMLVGIVVTVERRESSYGAYPALTIRKDDGDEVTFHAFRTVAKSELVRSRPVVGDRIGILYTGPVKGTDYHGYRIRLDRAVGTEIDWSEFEGDNKPADAAA